jgi:hypothetical protein
VALYVENKPAPFGQNYRQRIELKQPSLEALQWLAERDDVFVNRIEITLDFIFDSLAARDDAQEFLHFHLIRRWHSKKQQVRLYRGSEERDSRARDLHRETQPRNRRGLLLACRMAGKRIAARSVRWNQIGKRSARIRSPRFLEQTTASGRCQSGASRAAFQK